MSSSKISKPIKISTAVVILRGKDVLVVLRPDEPGEELPNIWGLPAASKRGQESHEERIRRIGREKLGVSLTVGVRLERGRQERSEYILDMELYGAWTSETPNLDGLTDPTGATLYADWRWADPESLSTAAENGSLCAELYLEHLRRP